MQASRWISLSAPLVLMLSGCENDPDEQPAAGFPAGTGAAGDALLSTGGFGGSNTGGAGLSTAGTSGSAYAATLAIDDEGSYLLTGNAAYRLVQGRASDRWDLYLGISPALMSDHF